MHDKNSLSGNSVIVRKNNLLHHEIDNDLVVVSIERGMYFGIEEIGKRIWSLIKTPQSISAICEILVQEYQIDYQVCQRDVIDFLIEALGEGIIEVHNL